MKKPSFSIQILMGSFFLLAMTALLAGCGAATGNNAATANNGMSTLTSTLTISPSSVTLTEGESYTFTVSGGSGTGYTYSVPAGNQGSVTTSSAQGFYVAPSSFTGTTLLQVTDSAGDTVYANITVSTSGGGGTGTTTSITGTLNDCVGVVGGQSNTNNWQVNGTELRTINDSNNYTESPVYCTGLSVAGQIPSTAVIYGVSVSIFLINQSSSTDGSLLQSLSLVDGGALIGSIDSLGLSIPGKNSSFPTFSEGSSSDTWGAALTPSIVNSSTFGIDIQTYRGNDRLFIGESSTIVPQITIYYQ